MASSGISLRILFVCVLASLVLVLGSCGQRQEEIRAADLHFETPLGFDWVKFEGKGPKIRDHWADCRDLIAQLGTVIVRNKTNEYVEKCAREKYSLIFAKTDQLPSWFRQGELSALVRGDSEPVSYDYSFLHRVYPDDPPENKARRREHASSIRKELEKIYGPPSATGYYDESSDMEFIADNSKEGPCQSWLAETVGILLCSERGILTDGIEMSLSFVRLDRIAHGYRLRCAIRSIPEGDCKDIFDSTSRRTTVELMRSIEILADWLGTDVLHNCKSEQLQPLEEIWTLSEKEEAEFKPELEARFGEDLAEFAIAYGSESVDEDQVLAQYKAVMYLFKQAASQGSATAMNEIGASLLYCYQNVQQDITAARSWLEQAANAGDKLAMKSLAFMHLSGMTDEIDPTKEAIRNLERCSKIDAEFCSKDLAALNTFIALRDE